MPDKYSPIITNNDAESAFSGSNDLFFSGKISDEFLLPIIESYIRYYASGDGHTAKAKKNDLAHFLNFLARGGIPHNKILVLDWTMHKTRDFVEQRIKIGESPATVSRRLATLKHLGRTLSERVVGFINPAREVKAPVFQLAKPQGLSDKEVSLLKSHVAKELKSETYNFLKIRNALILEFLLSTGLRADEIRLLVRGQFLDELTWIQHVKTKGKRFRDVYLSESIRPVVAGYLENSKQEIILKFPSAARFTKKDWSLFPFLISTHRASIFDPQTFSLAPKTLWTIISDFGKAVRIEDGNEISHIHPHKLRHTFAHGLLNSTKDVRIVAQALGHSDVRTTMRYTERTHEELAAAIEKKDSKN